MINDYAKKTDCLTFLLRESDFLMFFVFLLLQFG